jgi:carboxyl-terminal processing protease
MSRLVHGLGTALIVVLAFLVGRWTSPARALLETPQGSAFVSVFNNLQRYHLNPPPAGVLADAATLGLLKGLNDPFTIRILSDQAKVLEGLMRDGKEVGTGVGHHAWREDGTGDQITFVPPDSPGGQSGLQSGDVILAIDGKDVSHMTLDQVAQQRVGMAGTTMRLRILRNGHRFEVAVMRQQIEQKAVHHRLLRSGIGLIEIHNFFSAGVLEQFRAAVQALQNQGIRALVLDVRDNGGGLIEPVIQIADTFLTQGPILTTRDRNGQTRVTHQATTNPNDLNWSVAVLTNRYTASAAEILVSALRDAKRAVIVGQATRGKGVANGQVKLEDGSLLYIPIVEWLNTAGKSLHGQGIQPDQTVEDTRFTKPIELSIQGANPQTSLQLQLGKTKWQGKTDRQGSVVLDLVQKTSPNLKDAQLDLAIDVLSKHLN